MIRTDNRNASVDDPGVMRRKSLVEYAASLAAETEKPRSAMRRVGVGKSKSSGHIDMCTTKTNTDGETCTVSVSSFRIGGRKSMRGLKRLDARTVKSEAAYYSPRKPERIRSFKESGVIVASQSPTSVSEVEICVSPEIGPGNLSISIHEEELAQQFPSIEQGLRALHMSASFSDEETIEALFENDELVSIPASFRLSSSNMSVRSDLTGSIPTLDFHIASDQHGDHQCPLESDPSTAGGCLSVDCTPLPPRRRDSGRSSGEYPDERRAVPRQVRSNSIDSLPSKPARRASISTPDLEKSISTFNTSLSNDSAPMKPNRKPSRSAISNETSLHTSFSSIDTSPLKPERQSSSRLLNARLHRRMSTSSPLKRSLSRSDSLVPGRLMERAPRRDSISEDIAVIGAHEPTLLSRTHSAIGDGVLWRSVSTACPPRRTISRSESMARARMPGLVRRESITDDNRRRQSFLRVSSIKEDMAHVDE
jgi:hypothetical protein